MALGLKVSPGNRNEKRPVSIMLAIETVLVRYFFLD